MTARAFTRRPAVAGVTLWLLGSIAGLGCTTTFVPVRSQAVRAGTIAVRIVELRTWGTPLAAFVEIETSDGARLTGAHLALAASACGEGTPLVVSRLEVDPGNPTSRVEDIFVPQVAIDSRVPLPAPVPAGKIIAKIPLPVTFVYMSEHELTIDLTLAPGPDFNDSRCAKVDLSVDHGPGSNWRLEGSRLYGSAILRGAAPVGARAGHSEAGLDMEWGREFGRFRSAFRVDVGFAVCGGGCLVRSSDLDLFTYVGVGLGFEAIALRSERWIVGLGGGYRVRGFRESFVTEGGAHFVQQMGWAALRLLRTPPPLRGLPPALRRRAVGVELTIELPAGHALDGTDLSPRLAVGLVYQWP